MSSHMSEAGNQQSVLLEIELDPQVDANEAERLSRQLFLDIRQLDVLAVEQQVTEITPKGAKGLSFDWTTLLITFCAAGGVFTALITLARDWLLQRECGHRIKLTIDNDTIVLDRASARQRDALINTWIRRHSGE
jgi:hypothetical protein